MADESWQSEALGACFSGLKQNHQLFSAFPSQLAAILLQNKGVLTPADVNEVKKVKINEQTAKLFDILRQKTATNAKLVATVRQVFVSRSSLRSALAFLPKFEAPKITQQPGPSVIYCPLGKKVTLSCRADGKPVPQLQWYCGEYAIEGATAYEVDVDTPGNYFCVATNRVDSATSISVAIAIVKSEAPSGLQEKEKEHFYLQSILNAPPEIIARGPIARKAFYDAMKTGGYVRIRQAPLMVVGQDRSGKSTFVQAVVGKNPSEVSSSSTDGIEFTLVKCHLDDSDCKFVIPDPGNEIEIIERAQARFIAEKVRETEQRQEATKIQVAAPHQVVQQPEGETDENNQQHLGGTTSLNHQEALGTKLANGASSLQSIIIQEQYPTLTPRMERLVGEELKKLHSGNLEDLKDAPDRYLLLRISDFAGQPLHYNSHVYFLSDTGVYAIIFDLTKHLEDIAKVLLCVDGVEALIDTSRISSYTNLDYFKTWMISITSTKGHVPATESGNLVTRRFPSVMFIGSKLDELFLSCPSNDFLMTEIMKKKEQILYELVGDPKYQTNAVKEEEQSQVSTEKQCQTDGTKVDSQTLHISDGMQQAYGRNKAHLRDPMFFFVDNFKTIPGSEREFIAIRKRIVQLAMEQPNTTQLIAFSWILLELELYKRRKVSKYLSLKEVVDLAQQHQVRTEHVDIALKHFDDMGVVVYRPESRLLETIVVIDPDWLVRAFRSIIRIKLPVWLSDPNNDAWEKVSKTGILQYSFIENILTTPQSNSKEKLLAESKPELTFLVDLFQMFSLLVAYIQAFSQLTQYRSSISTATSRMTVSQFVAPSLVAEDPDWELFVARKDIDPRHAEVKPIYISSLTCWIPDALYNQLVVRCIGKYPLCPEIYRYFARVHIDYDYDLLLINCKPCEKHEPLAIDLKEANGKVMITVVRVSSFRCQSRVSNVCQEALQFILYAVDDIKGTGMHGLQLTLETAVWMQSSYRWIFHRLSRCFSADGRNKSTQHGQCALQICKRHSIEACASIKCFEEVFLSIFTKQDGEEHAKHLNKDSCPALVMWVSSHEYPSNEKNRPLLGGCYTEQGGFLTQPCLGIPSDPVRGDNVEIKCVAQSTTGHPVYDGDVQGLNYEWRFKGKVIRLSNQQRTYGIRAVNDEDCGIYTCRVFTIGGDFSVSRPAMLKLPAKKQLKVISKVVCNKDDHEQKSWIEATTTCIQLGERLYFMCTTKTGVDVQYQWYFQGKPIPAATKSCYEIQQVRDYHDGEYVCKVRKDDDYFEETSKPVVLHLSDEPKYQEAARGISRARSFPLSGKVALLIGNATYDNSSVHKSLKLPTADVHTMSSILKNEYKFQTITLVDLNLFEMMAALELFYGLVKKGVYAVFYYAGHGFQANNEQYLLPVDADDENDIRKSIRAEGIAYELQCCKADLSLLILDCCRVRLVSQQRKNVLSLQQSETVLTFSSCLPSRKTYEIADGCHKNSIFTSLLAAKLTEAAKTSLPSEVGEEVVKVMNDTKEEVEKKCKEMGMGSLFLTLYKLNMMLGLRTLRKFAPA
ncbi:uncharacterized protein LOC134184567 isoform X2 [Corticium candelabrum]|uniref:uncharacterized protein LOC134184567 isoform X2 n=1 Tax=Corticium candelabrum TaxID=121492 RepID=UPI002E2732D1|nr:uncharacterized protein LOC134184567 isoform X2 [Corticium candelabrum]